MAAKKSLRVPEKVRPKYDAIVALTDAFSQTYLDDEYREMARYLTAALARKRPSPIMRGKAEGWAAGVIHVLGTVNFLFDKSFEPYVKVPVIWKEIGISEATGSAKSRQIRKLFDIYQMSPEWTLPSRVANNPYVWFVESPNGMIVDARGLPLEIQELLVEQGLIPFVADGAVSMFGADLAEDLFANAMGDGEVVEVVQRDSHKVIKPIVKGSKQCQLCGNTENLIRTHCCNQWICNDVDDYVMFSYDHNSCYRNHDRYTLCSFHSHEGHKGRWQDCKQCRADMEPEMYVWHGTNDYNFEVLKNPPTFEPTHCATCNRVISLTEDGYSMTEKGYICLSCSPSPF